MVFYVISYTLKDQDLWKEHEAVADRAIKLLNEFDGVKDVQYFYVVVGETRWKRYFLVEMDSMGIRDRFFEKNELVETLRELTSFSDPSTHTDMFWEKAPTLY